MTLVNTEQVGLEVLQLNKKDIGHPWFAVTSSRI